MADPKEVWLVAKMAGADYSFRAFLEDLAQIPELIRVDKVTKITMGRDGKVELGMWGAERLGMTDGPILLFRDQLTLLAPASPALVDDLERGWDMKTIIGQTPKKLVLP